MNYTLKIEELPNYNSNIFSAEHIPQHEHVNSSRYYDHSIGYHNHSYDQYEYYYNNNEEYIIESIRILLEGRIISRDAYDRILYILNSSLLIEDQEYAYLEKLIKSNKVLKNDSEFIKESEMIL